MSIEIYNTKTGQKSPLVTLEEGKIKLYVCGITAYDYCHIGHARSALVFDMIVRYLRYRGYEVTFIRNFTDIDDKIIKRAQEQNTTCEELSNRFITMFHEDMASLGILPPTIEPKATEHLPEIIGLIEDLIRKGLAYQVAADVYFRVTGFNGYGSLSGRNLDEMQAGARVSINEKKEHPMDFALWKGSKPGEPTWESPWGPGRPGWHIECSAMSRKYLGNSFDIHGGGKDLIFPHHENEMAQSEGATGEEFVKYWMHHGFVTIKEEKMSKSLGNFLTIREVIARFAPEALRLFIFSTHYRNPLDYSEAALLDAVAGLNRLYTCLAEIEQLPATGNDQAASAIPKTDREKIETIAERFRKAMDNDFNSAQALGHLFEGVKIINKIRQHLPGKPASLDLQLLKQGAETTRDMANTLGLLTENPTLYLQKEQGKILKTLSLTPEEIENAITERTTARETKNWTLADEIRDQLLAKGIELKDGPAGTAWQVKLP
ncbi:MAG TPA: cysteine--tRNA ligase [Desulfobulbaceae bacterium]|nr:MAG: cysteine--tRNA ligase [Deltaproteobacteria bacterium RIFOXYD12_FULL_53_23]HCC53931.1 cysteine--tRNA ligase [Desulfobulbaceae bacterium]